MRRRHSYSSTVKTTGAAAGQSPRGANRVFSGRQQTFLHFLGRGIVIPAREHFSDENICNSAIQCGGWIFRVPEDPGNTHHPHRMTAPCSFSLQSFRGTVVLPPPRNSRQDMNGRQAACVPQGALCRYWETSRASIRASSSSRAFFLCSRHSIPSPHAQRAPGFRQCRPSRFAPEHDRAPMCRTRPRCRRAPPIPASLCCAMRTSLVIDICR